MNIGDLVQINFDKIPIKFHGFPWNHLYKNQIGTIINILAQNLAAVQWPNGECYLYKFEKLMPASDDNFNDAVPCPSMSDILVNI